MTIKCYTCNHLYPSVLTECPICNTKNLEKKEEPNNPVNHPAHYTSDPSGVECITITRHRNFNVGNAIKYLWRAGLKNQGADKTENIKNQIQDLKKAIWYINDEINRLDKTSPTFE